MTQIINFGTTTVDLHKWVKTDDGLGGRSMKIGTRTGEVEMIIDTKKLIGKVRTALHAKTGRTTMAENGIIFRVVPGTVKEEMLEEPEPTKFSRE